MNRSFSKLNKLKIKLLALFVSLMVILEAGLMAGDTFANKDNIDVSSKLVAIDSDTNTEKFEVSIKGEEVSKNEAADIVLCIDTSANMNQERGTVPNQYTKLDKVKEAVREFCRGLADAKTGNLIENVRIGICEFGHELNQNVKERNDYVKVDSTYYKAGDMVKGSKDDAKEICALTNNIEEINKSLDTLNKSKQGEINLEAGIDCAGNMLEKNSSKKYIVLFTNGAPTISNDHGYGKSYENVYAKAGDANVSGENVESLAYFKDGKWNRCLQSKSNDVHFKETQKAYNNLLGGISGIGSKNSPMYKNNELKVYSICETSDLNKKDEKNSGATKFPYDDNSECAKVSNLLESISNPKGFKEVVDINKVSDSFKEVEKSIEKDVVDYPLANAKCEVAVSEECIPPNADELKEQLSEEINNKVINDIEVDGDNSKILFTLGDVRESELTFVYSLKCSNDVPAINEAPKMATLRNLAQTSLDAASAELRMDKVKITMQAQVFGIEDIATNNQINPPQLSDDAKKQLEKKAYGVMIRDEIYATYPILLRGDKGTAYNFRLIPDNINSSDNTIKLECLMKDDSVSMDEISAFFKKYNGSEVELINMETYKISQLAPMFHRQNKIEVKTITTANPDGSTVVYEGDNINNAVMKLEKGVTEVQIVFKNNMNDKLGWFSKFYVDSGFGYFIPPS